MLFFMSDMVQLEGAEAAGSLRWTAQLFCLPRGLQEGCGTQTELCELTIQ